MTGSEKKNLPAEGTRDPAAPSHEHPNNLSRDIALQVSNMLSVDFSTPLSGAARAERIRQLSHNHASRPLLILILDESDKSHRIASI